MFTNTIVVLASALAMVSAAPTSTTPEKVSRTVTLTGTTHSVVVGRAGLHFDPENVVAEVGDVVEWHYLPKNHSVVQSSFGQPCQPENADSFFSGFFPTDDGQNPEVFQIVVQDSAPIWYYCSQTTGSHCQNGMAGVINQNFNSPNTLAKYKELAATTGVSTSQANIQGGDRILNPNPQSGF